MSSAKRSRRQTGALQRGRLEGAGGEAVEPLHLGARLLLPLDEPAVEALLQLGAPGLQRLLALHRQLLGVGELVHQQAGHRRGRPAIAGRAGGAAAPAAPAPARGARPGRAAPTASRSASRSAGPAVAASSRSGRGVAGAERRQPPGRVVVRAAGRVDQQHAGRPGPGQELGVGAGGSRGRVATRPPRGSGRRRRPPAPAPAAPRPAPRRRARPPRSRARASRSSADGSGAPSQWSARAESCRPGRSTTSRSGVPSAGTGQRRGAAVVKGAAPTPASASTSTPTTLLVPWPGRPTTAMTGVEGRSRGGSGRARVGRRTRSRRAAPGRRPGAASTPR